MSHLLTIIELLISIVITLIVVATATSALMQAQRVTAGIALEANMQQNLRAGMHFLVRDLTQAGEGIPAAGISLPNTGAGISAVVRPGTTVAGVFHSKFVVRGVVPDSRNPALKSGVPWDEFTRRML